MSEFKTALQELRSGFDDALNHFYHCSVDRQSQPSSFDGCVRFARLDTVIVLSSLVETSVVASIVLQQSFEIEREKETSAFKRIARRPKTKFLDR